MKIQNILLTVASIMAIKQMRSEKYAGKTSPLSTVNYFDNTPFWTKHSDNCHCIFCLEQQVSEHGL